jgi:hypothetical protein
MRRFKFAKAMGALPASLKSFTKHGRKDSHEALTTPPADISIGCKPCAHISLALHVDRLYGTMVPLRWPRILFSEIAS